MNLQVEACSFNFAPVNMLAGAKVSRSMDILLMAIERVSAWGGQTYREYNNQQKIQSSVHAVSERVIIHLVLFASLTACNCLSSDGPASSLPENDESQPRL